MAKKADIESNAFKQIEDNNRMVSRLVADKLRKGFKDIVDTINKEMDKTDSDNLVKLRQDMANAESDAIAKGEIVMKEDIEGKGETLYRPFDIPND